MVLSPALCRNPKITPLRLHSNGLLPDRTLLPSVNLRIYLGFPTNFLFSSTSFNCPQSKIINVFPSHILPTHPWLNPPNVLLQVHLNHVPSKLPRCASKFAATSIIFSAYWCNTVIVLRNLPWNDSSRVCTTSHKIVISNIHVSRCTATNISRWKSGITWQLVYLKWRTKSASVISKELALQCQMSLLGFQVLTLLTNCMILLTSYLTHGEQLFMVEKGWVEEINKW